MNPNPIATAGLPPRHDPGSRVSHAAAHNPINREKPKMKVRPLNDRVLVKRVAEEEKTSGGLFIPETAKEKPARGLVVSVGPGCLNDDGKRIALEVKEGDQILFGKYAGTEIKLDADEHMILKEDEILAVIEG